jgi:hypothetical protein
MQTGQTTKTIILDQSDSPRLPDCHLRPGDDLTRAADVSESAAAQTDAPLWFVLSRPRVNQNLVYLELVGQRNHLVFLVRVIVVGGIKNSIRIFRATMVWRASTNFCSSSAVGLISVFLLRYRVRWWHSIGWQNSAPVVGTRFSVSSFAIRSRTIAVGIFPSSAGRRLSRLNANHQRIADRGKN